MKQLVSKSQFIQQIGWILTQGQLQWGHNCFMKTTRARCHQLLLDWTCANLPTFSWGALCENANVWVRTSELLRVSPAGLLEKTPMSQCVIRRIHCERGGVVVMTFLTRKYKKTPKENKSIRYVLPPACCAPPPPPHHHLKTFWCERVGPGESPAVLFISWSQTLDKVYCANILLVFISENCYSRSLTVF